MVEVPAVHFDLRRLMTLSLLLNEVVTNSVKHALERKTRDYLRPARTRDKERFLLTVQYDGPGLAKDSSKGLGLASCKIWLRSLVARSAFRVSRA
jgi:two-component sensor histidine kinase